MKTEMKEEWKIGIGIATGILIPLVIFTMWYVSFYRTDKETESVACLPLPSSFSESDLVGTWTGYYFGHTDKLIIRADGTYKQIYSGDYINFESEWQKWYIEYDKYGYLRLHLAGMRRCDGLDSECNDPGGGLPSSSTVVNPCPSGEVILNDEVILFVTGTTSDVPLGILLRQARLAGSDWTYTFRLEK